MSGEETESPKKLTTIEAFSKPPDLKTDNPMLFDHALLQHTDGDTKFAVGNLMALSAPGKGMKKEGGVVTSDLMAKIDEHGKAITKEWIKNIKKAITENNGNLNETLKKECSCFKQIELIKDNWENIMGSVDKKKFIEKVQQYAGDMMDNIVKKKLELSDEKVEELKKKIIDKIGKRKKVNDNNDIVEVNSYILQDLGNNEIWDLQNLGGFVFPPTEYYQPFRSETLDKNYKVPSDTIEDFIKASVPKDGILFLCESAIFDISDYEHVSIDKTIKKNIDTNQKRYSAIFKTGSDYKVEEATGLEDMLSTDDNNDKTIISKQDYAVFNVKKKGKGKGEGEGEEELFKVAVVHVNDKAAVVNKDGSVEPNNEKWKTFLTACQKNKIKYVVGDTNVTKKKVKKNTHEFFNTLTTGILVKKTEFNISKERVKINIFLNNQIYKADETNEPDGMVILNMLPTRQEKQAITHPVGIVSPKISASPVKGGEEGEAEEENNMAGLEDAADDEMDIRKILSFLSEEEIEKFEETATSEQKEKLKKALSDNDETFQTLNTSEDVKEYLDNMSGGRRRKSKKRRKRKSKKKGGKKTKNKRKSKKKKGKKTKNKRKRKRKKTRKR